MTNAQIILDQSISLMESGIIKGTGRMMKLAYIDEDGNEVVKDVEEPEIIHTYAAWQQLGYQVKRGSKAVASFTIWKHVGGKKDKETGEEQDDKMFMKKAHFFTFAQVEKIEK